MLAGKRKALGPWTVVACFATSVAALPALAQNATPAPSAPVAAPELPAATPMTDLLTRMDALETQVTRLTAQNEELANRQHQLETKLAAAAAPATTGTMGPTIAGDAPTSTPSPAPAPASPGAANAGNLSAMTGGASDRTGSDHAAGPAHASAQRIAAVKAVIKPQTADAGLDDYSYGFRLYTAKFYPEAAQQLKLYIDKYPKDSHISQARNLLGRSYLDDGKPRDAAPWFLTNYKTDPHGPRAADSLLNLAAAMRQLGDSTRACIALNEFAANYAPEAQGRLREDYAKTQHGLTCN